MFQGGLAEVERNEEQVLAGADGARWQAVKAGAASADGSFYYAVATTGVYCRPSCSARLPRRENVSFYRSVAEAEAAGFRACKRCKPEQAPADERRAQQVAELCRFITRSLDEAGVVPGLQELAAHAGLSPHHLHRSFKAVTGLTPRAYGAAQKAQRLRSELESQASVTSAAYRAGFGSSSRLHSASQQHLGMTPSRYRAGGQAGEGRGATLAAMLDIHMESVAVPIKTRPKSVRQRPRASRTIQLASSVSMPWRCAARPSDMPPTNSAITASAGHASTGPSW